MLEYTLGAGYALKQLTNFVKELGGLKAHDRKTDDEVAKLKAAIKALQRRDEALLKAQDHQGKVLDHQGKEAEQMKAEIRELQKQAHGLKVKLGKSKAENARLTKQ